MCAVRILKTKKEDEGNVKIRIAIISVLPVYLTCLPVYLFTSSPLYLFPSLPLCLFHSLPLYLSTLPPIP